MTILMTGTTGLVGARLLPRLLNAGLECRVLLRPGTMAPAGAKSVPGDILDPASLVEAVAGVSAVVHLAAVFRTPDEDLIWRTNREGTLNLIAAVKAHAPTARFILASTSHVYGTDKTHPGREDDAVDPSHAYPASKAAAEKALRDSGLNWSVLRFPFVYGDGDGHFEALPEHLAAGNWHPAQRLSTIHHRDLAMAVQMALDGQMDGRIVNIADDAPTSVYELASLVGKPMHGSSAPLENPWHLHVDASLARSLGFQPSVGTVFQAIREKLL
jgi:nucleoside-diphosphate-sugar epimerase